MISYGDNIMRKVEKKTAYHLQVYDILKQQILSGDLAPGEKINEYKISQEIGVSRCPPSGNPTVSFTVFK